MAGLCTCPRPAAITDISSFNCEEYIGQIQGVMIQRQGQSIVVATDNPELKATWSSLAVANDDSKVQLIPLLDNPTFEVGSPREYGGGNQTRGGVVRILGSNTTTFTADLVNVPQSVIKEVKAQGCEKLQIYFINESGQIIGKTNTGDTEFSGFSAQTFFVGDKNPGGYDSVDINQMTISLEPNWSDNLKIYTPTDFDPRDGITA
jgi:hypothetical protein